MSRITVCFLFLALCASTLAQDDEAITSKPVTEEEDSSSETTVATTSTTTTTKVPEILQPPLVQSRQFPGVECHYYSVTLKAGDKHSLNGECVQLTCHADGMLTGVACPFVLPPPGCQVSGKDFTKPFPHCCEKWSC